LHVAVTFVLGKQVTPTVSLLTEMADSPTMFEMMSDAIVDTLPERPEREDG
jgi:hypothetical protein